MLNGLKFSGRFGLKYRLSVLILFIFETDVVFPSVIRLQLSIYSCDKSLTLIMVPFRKKQGAGSERRFCYILRVNTHIPLYSKRTVTGMCEAQVTERQRPT